MKLRLPNGGTFLPPLITLLFCVLVLGIYVPKTLMGNFDQHVLPSKMFGVPNDVRKHGFTELYSAQESGWDGQFYYYIANDLFATKDTPAHLDAAAYRYQRIGLPLLANLLSKLALQSWVAPGTYYLTSLLLILAATARAARYFSRHGIPPLIILAWSLGFGTQVTLLNGLPDAAADALLILALLWLLERRMWLYAVTITLAALSREIYVLVPLAMLGMHGVAALRMWPMDDGSSKRQAPMALLQRWLPHMLAPAIFLCWQLYLRVRFGVSPSSQAAGILGAPFVSTLDYLWQSLSGHHPLLPNRSSSYAQAGLLLGYIALGIATAIALTKALLHGLHNGAAATTAGIERQGFNLAMLGTVALYTAFGPTVMMHHTGYLKAANIFLFILPFAAGQYSLSFVRQGFWTCVWLTTVVVMVALTWARIGVSPGYGRYLQPASIAAADSAPDCISMPQAQLSLAQTTPQNIWPHNLWTFWRPDAPQLYEIEIRNTSTSTFSPYAGKGAVNLSYQWLDSQGRIVRDGVRTPLVAPLAAGQSTVRPIIVERPFWPGQYRLRVSLVQEGCFWFYQVNPASVLDVPYK